MTGLGDNFLVGEKTRRYPKPWSRARSVVFLIGMVAFAVLLTWGGLHVLNHTIVWR
ncbi:MAG TPA: hypothetical protein VE569_13805 [Acidimicrobiia bacterium]|nr:hypothetical protein [Acidimicrobiia bacterium]